jgi:hypothetical protein
LAENRQLAKFQQNRATGRLLRYCQETDKQQTVNNTVNGVVKGGEGNNIQNLHDLDQPQEKTAYVAQFLLDELGDQQSEKFYRLVAAKIPETVIREALSAIRVDGAEHPAKLFTYKMQRYGLHTTFVQKLSLTYYTHNLMVVRYGLFCV